MGALQGLETYILSCGLLPIQLMDPSDHRTLNQGSEFPDNDTIACHLPSR